MPIYSDKTVREGGLKNQKKLQVHVSVNIVYQTNTNVVTIAQ